MRTINHLKRNLIVFACLGLLLSIAVWSSGRISGKQIAPQELQVRVQNKTHALKILSSRKVGEGYWADFEVQLMNQSGKMVLAYTFSSGESGVTSFGLSLAPGDYKTEKIPFGNLEPSADKSVSYLRLSAVYFEDGSSEGENVNVARLTNRMAGIREQAVVGLQAMRKAALLGEADPERLTKTIEDDISSTPVAQESTEIASERSAGRAYIREKISRDLKEISSNRSFSASQVHERLETLIARIEKISGTRLVKKEGNK